jgi:hypothetical protein
VVPYPVVLCNKGKKCNTEWAHRRNFVKHFKKHFDGTPKTEGHWECCTEGFTDAEKFLEHIWDAHTSDMTSHLPISTNPPAPHSAASRTSHLYNTPIFIPTNTFGSSSAPSSSYKSSVAPQPFADASGPSSSGPHPPAMLPNNEDSLHISGEDDMDWPCSSVSRGLFKLQPYSTIHASQYSSLFEPGFDNSDFALYRP